MAKEKTATIISVEYVVTYFNKKERKMSDDITVYVPYGTPDKNLMPYFMAKMPEGFQGVAFYDMTGKAQRNLHAMKTEDFIKNSYIKKSEIVDLKDIKPEETE